ncbi:hypothetical protein PCE1_004993 [Barthelona sp. PCE]
MSEFNDRVLGGSKLLWYQLLAFFRKNTLKALRSVGFWLIRILLVTIICYTISFTSDLANGTSYNTDAVDLKLEKYGKSAGYSVKCDYDYFDCVPLIYAPNTDFVREQFVSKLATKLDFDASDAVGVDSLSDMNDKAAEIFPNRFALGILYNPTEYSIGVLTNPNLNQGNYIEENLMEEQLSRIFIDIGINDTMDITISTSEWPHDKLNTGEKYSASSIIYNIFFGIGFCTIIYFTLQPVAEEKDKGFWNFFKTMGVTNSAYWLGWIPFILLSFIAFFAFLLVGAWYVDVDFMQKMELKVIVVLFLCFLIPFSGFVIFLAGALRTAGARIGWFFALFLCSAFSILFNALIFGFQEFGFTMIILRFIGTLPVMSLQQCIFLISGASSTNNVIGLKWDDWANLQMNSNSWSLIGIVMWANLWGVIHIICGIYFDYLRASIKGGRGSPLLPFLRGKAPPASKHDVQSLFKDADIRRAATISNQENAINDHPLILRGVRLTYSSGFNSSNRKDAIKNVSLPLKRGQISSLLGSNGAAKTTTLHTILGLLEATGGSVFCFGKYVMSNLNYVRRRIGFVPQHNVVFDHLNAIETINFYRRIRGLKPSNEKAIDELTTFGLEEVVSGRRVGAFSGGMKRRLAVIIGFIGDCPLLLLDEASANLDPLSKRTLMNVILGKMEENKNMTVLVTSHDLDEVSELTTGDIFIMHEGELKAYGHPNHLRQKFGKGWTIHSHFKEHADTAGFRLAIQEDPKFTHAVFNKHTDEEVSIIIPLERQGDVQALLNWISENGDEFGLETFTVDVPGLHDVFMQATKYNPGLEDVGSVDHTFVDMDAEALMNISAEEAKSPAQRVIVRLLDKLQSQTDENERLRRELSELRSLLSAPVAETYAPNPVEDDCIPVPTQNDVHNE